MGKNKVQRHTEVQVHWPSERTIINEHYPSIEPPDEITMRCRALELACRSNKLSLGSDDVADLIEEAEAFMAYMRDGVVPEHKTEPVDG